MAEALHTLIGGLTEGVDDQQTWSRQFDLGLAWVNFPLGHGGLGAGPTDQMAVDDALRRAGVTDNWTRNPVGVGIVAPILVDFGTEAQRRQWLKPAFTCQEVWCQLFSERAAGSDLASMTTTAQSRDGSWLVSGQKVWTTLAHRARWGLLLARTGPAGSRHRGLTMFVLDMTAPGVVVTPLRMITGQAEFNQVDLDSVEVDDRRRVGEVGQGWKVAMSVLSAERMSIGSRVPPQGQGPIAEVVAAWRRSARRDPGTRHRLVELWVQAEATRLTNLRARQGLARGQVGPEASTPKLTFARLNQATSEMTLELMGPDALDYDYTYGQPSEVGWRAGETAKAFLRSRANSIEGGTSEVLLTAMAERVLGLPSEPRPPA